jgi:hypothetical protein
MIKMLHNFFKINDISKFSSLSNVPSNYFNFLSNYASISIGCIKFLKGLQSILGSLGHLFKLSNYKQHFLILISILAKTNDVSFNL